MSRVVAIFDVDQTLVQGNTERFFFRYLVREGLITWSQALSFLGQLAFRPQDRLNGQTPSLGNIFSSSKFIDSAIGISALRIIMSGFSGRS